MTNPTVRRVSKACIRCRLRKTRCSGGQPCEKCLADGVNCEFGSQKPRRSLDWRYVEYLEQQRNSLGCAIKAAWSQWAPREELQRLGREPGVRAIAERLGVGGCDCRHVSRSSDSVKKERARSSTLYGPPSSQAQTGTSTMSDVLAAMDEDSPDELEDSQTSTNQPDLASHGPEDQHQQFAGIPFGNDSIRGGNSGLSWAPPAFSAPLQRPIARDSSMPDLSWHSSSKDSASPISSVLEPRDGSNGKTLSNATISTDWSFHEHEAAFGPIINNSSIAPGWSGYDMPHTHFVGNVSTMPNWSKQHGQQELQGYQGLQGDQDLREHQGLHEHRNLQGYQGLQGHEGLQGPQGPQGPQRPQEQQGYQELQGRQGQPPSNVDLPLQVKPEPEQTIEAPNMCDCVSPTALHHPGGGPAVPLPANIGDPNRAIPKPSCSGLCVRRWSSHRSVPPSDLKMDLSNLPKAEESWPTASRDYEGESDGAGVRSALDKFQWPMPEDNPQNAVIKGAMKEQPMEAVEELYGSGADAALNDFVSWQ